MPWASAKLASSAIAAVEILDRLQPVALAVQRLAEQVVHARLRRPDGDGAAGELDALLELALLAGDHGDVIERVGVLRVGAQHLDIALHGLREVALAVVKQALLEQLRGGRGFGHEAGSKQALAGMPSACCRPGAGPVTPFSASAEYCARPC